MLVLGQLVDSSASAGSYSYVVQLAELQPLSFVAASLDK